MTYGLHVIDYPSGRYGFVGNVPAKLAYAVSDESIYEVIAQVGPGMARGIAKSRGITMQSLSWESKEAAIAYAKALGFAVSNNTSPIGAKSKGRGE